MADNRSDRAGTDTDTDDDRTLVHRAGATADDEGVRTDDDAVTMALAMAGEAEAATDATSPEHLMAAALAGCLHQAVRVAASSLGDIGSTPSVTATVTLRTGDGVGYSASFDLQVSGLSGDHADDVLKQALALCPFTAALEGRSLTVSRS